MIKNGDTGTEGAGMRTLHCELGDHDWTKPRTKGRQPRNCPEHAVKITADGEAVKIVDPEAARRRAKARIDALELMLRSRGTHISQNREEWAA